MTLAQDFRSRLTPRSVGTLIGAAGIGLLAWPVPVVGPSPGLDASFIAGLHMAGAAGLDVGTEIVSTYGPLGFLSFPLPVYGLTSALAVIHAAAIVFPLVWILLHRSAQAVPPWLAIVLAYVGTQAIRWLGVPEMALALAGILAILALERAAAGWSLSVWGVAAAGILATIVALGKLNTGAVVLAVAVVTVAAIGGWRQVLILMGSMLGTAVAVWIVTGQDASNLFPFLSSSGAMVMGFNAAMGLDQDPSVHWMVSAACLAMLALAYAVHEPMLTWSPRLRIAVLLVATMIAFITLKAAFVRWHYQFIFATLVIFAIALLSPRIPRRTGILTVAMSVIVLLGASRVGLDAYLDPTPRAGLALVPSFITTADEARDTREALAAAYGVDESMLARMRGASVHIGPLETGVAFAYPDMEWAPLPVYQDYMAYTPSLDNLNTDFLQSANGPQFILRHAPVAIDGKNPWFEGPRTIRAMLCQYREVEVDDTWQLLERDRDLCADPVLVSHAVTRPGVPVEVPPLSDRDAMMFVRIHGLEPGITDAAWSFAVKAHEWYITRDETDQFRLVAPTAGQGLVMALGEALEHTEPHAFGQPWRSVTVSPGPRSTGPPVELRLEFWVVRTVPSSADS